MPLVGLCIVATFLPLAAAVLALLLSLHGRGRLAGLISVGGSGVVLCCTLALFTEQLRTGQGARLLFTWLPSLHTIQLGLQLDGLSVSMLLIVALVALCVQVFSLGYMADESAADYGRYFAEHSFFLFAMNVLVLAPNLLQLFIGWELVGLASYLLIGFYYKKPSAARAALKAFCITKLADMGFIAALVVLFAHTGSFAWDQQTIVAGSVSLLLFVAVMGKSAQFPLHVWLPDAMEGPTPVSALLHAATMVAAGVYLVARAFPLFAQAPGTLQLMAYIGSFTALFGALLASVQQDIKRVLAYSTCSQLGYMVCGLGAGSASAGFFHLTTHAFFKALLFLAAGGLIHAVRSNDIRHMGGLLRKQPVSAGCFIVGSLALAGIPGFSGFFSKDLILERVLEQRLWLPLVALLTAAFATALYMGRVIVIALLGQPNEHAEHAEHAHGPGPAMTWPLIMLALPAAGSGYFGATLTRLYGEPLQLHVSVVGGVAAALAIAGLVTAHVLFGRNAVGKPSLLAPFLRLAHSGAVDRVFVFAYRRVLSSFAAACALFDRYIVDGLMNAIAVLTLQLGTWLRPVQTGNLLDYVYAVVIATLALGAALAVMQ